VDIFEEVGGVLGRNCGKIPGTVNQRRFASPRLTTAVRFVVNDTNVYRMLLMYDVHSVRSLSVVS
jgi:hypothetical protein